MSKEKERVRLDFSKLTTKENTILRVGRVLVEHQQAFFLEKTKELRPLLLQDVALKLGLHESTISRAVNGKYLQTRFGTFELKSFLVALWLRQMHHQKAYRLIQ